MDSLTTAYISLATIIGVWLFSKWTYSYWRRVGLENPDTESIFGNTKEFLIGRLALGDQFKIIYEELKSRGLKHGGCYLSLRPVYMPIDLDLIKTIMQKDFNHFVNHGVYYNEEADPLSGHLINLEDERWKNMRAKMTPAFTPAKTKMMFQTLVSCTPALEEVFKDHSVNQDAVDIKDVVSRFTIDVIFSVAFGIECNTLKHPDSDFRQCARNLFRKSFSRTMRRIISLVIPRAILLQLGFKVMPRDVEDFFMNVIRSAVRYRENNNIDRDDFLHLLLQLQKGEKIAEDQNSNRVEVNGKTGHMLTFNEIAAQCFVFFIAGFETSATTMTFALLELALNQDIQERLRSEIRTVLKNHGGQLTHQAVMSMSYLDKVIHETLRLYPPLPGIVRVCNKAYKVPHTNVVLKVGTRVHIPLQAIQRDPEYYPDPDEFDPERFNEETKSNRHPYAFMPFGEGPRICIGARLGMLQVKVGIAAILKNYRVTLNDKMKFPVKFSPSEVVMTVEGGVWLNVTRID